MGYGGGVTVLWFCGVAGLWCFGVAVLWYFGRHTGDRDSFNFCVFVTIQQLAISCWLLAPNAHKNGM